jgi:hypothetical protein
VVQRFYGGSTWALSGRFPDPIQEGAAQPTGGSGQADALRDAAKRKERLVEVRGPDVHRRTPIAPPSTRSRLSPDLISFGQVETYGIDAVRFIRSAGTKDGRREFESLRNERLASARSGRNWRIDPVE